MELKDRLNSIDQKFMVAGALVVLIGIGFVVSNFAPNTGLASGSGDNYRTETLSHGSPVELEDDAAVSRDAAGSGGGDRKISVSMSLTLDVGDVVEARDNIESSTEKFGGYVDSSSTSRSGEQKGSMRVQVPDENLSEFENELEEIGKIKDRDVNRRDVTDSYNQLEAEIESLENEYQRLQELMNRSEEVEDLIKVQERLSEVNSQLDYKKDRFEDLQEEVQYSEVRIKLEGPQSFESRFELRETVSDSYSAVFKTVKFLIIGIGYLLPLALIYLLYLGVKRFRDRL